MKLAILGDTHFGARGDSQDFHNFFEKFYMNTFFPYLKENNIDTVFQQGICLIEENISISIHSIVADNTFLI